jgi:hypothetical protein
VLTVHYPDATNFEGRKILVYRHKGDGLIAIEQLVAGGELDPHFCSSPNSPIARFAPTTEGARLARIFVESVT